VAALALQQHGVVSLAQLRECGLSASGVRARVAAGKLHGVHRGVYAVGHRVLDRDGRWMAAVLACGPGAVLSHRSAAALWGLRPTSRRAVDVIAPRGSRRPRAGIEIHRADSLRPIDTTSRNGVPCTTIARTLLDLAEVAPVERALDQAEILRLLDARALGDAIAAAAGRRGAAILRTLLAGYDTANALTRSELEAHFLALCRGAALPVPEVNAWLTLPDGTPVQPDFLWRAQRLIVEADGHATHGTRRAFEQDRVRDQRALLAGWRTLRCTWRQVLHEPDALARTLAALLT
jgi:predicted transcriptional regulator of viral defense system